MKFKIKYKDRHGDNDWCDKEQTIDLDEVKRVLEQHVKWKLIENHIGVKDIVIEVINAD